MSSIHLLRERLREYAPPSEHRSSQDSTLEAVLETRGLVQLGGNGKSTIALSRTLQALRAGSAAAWIATETTFLPLEALEAGGLDQLLFIRVGDGKALLRAADLLLSCPGAVEVATLALPERFRPPPQQLLRLQRQAERSHSTLFLLDLDAEQAPSFGVAISARVHARRRPPPAPDWSLALTVTHRKGGPSGPLVERLPHAPHRLRSHCSL